MSLLSFLKRIIIHQPYQRLRRYSIFKGEGSFLQKWRGHHPNVDEDGMSVIYEEASIPGTTCALPFTGIK